MKTFKDITHQYSKLTTSNWPPAIRWLILATTCLLFQTAQAALLTNDFFNYVAGTTLANATNGAGTPGGWANSRGAITIVNGNLDGMGLGLVASSGNMVQVSGGGAAVNNGSTLDFTGQTAGAVYFSFLFRLADTTGIATSSPGTNIVSLNQKGSASKESMSINLLNSGGNLEFGVAKYADSTNVLTSQFITSGTGSAISVETVYLVVGKYSIASGTADDTLSLWIVRPT